jgi:hypothetical protein
MSVCRVKRIPFIALLQAILYETPRRNTGSSSVSSSPEAPSPAPRPQSVDVRKAEIFINTRQAENQPDGAWCGMELFRQLNQASRQGGVYDYAAISCLQPEGRAGMGQQGGG